MNPLPKNKSEETKFPVWVVILIACFAIGAALIFGKARRAKQESITLPNTETPTAEGGGTSSSEERVAIDLSKFFNADRHSNWLGGMTALRGLSDLPSGIIPLQDVPFKIDEIVQLCGVGVRADSSKFPKSIEGIPVKRKCARLHFLHSTGWTMPKNTQIGAYVVHYDDASHEEIPIVFGIDMRDWLFSPKDPTSTNNAAWYSMTSPMRENFRLYQSTWTNSKPDVTVKAIDFVSYGTKCAPFLLAITADTTAK
jgi:hypothetical protein